MPPIPANNQPARDWELTCDHCNGCGFVYVERQVAERKSDVQEFKEECECCEGRGFVFAFDDIPGIEQYVKSVRPASVAPGDAQDELTRDRIEEIAHEVYKVERFTKDDEVWHNMYWLTSFAKAIEKELRRPAPAAGDARAITLPAKMPKHEGNGSEYPSSESYHEGYAEGWNDAIDAAIAAQAPHKGEAA